MWRALAVFKGAGFLILDSPFPLAGSDVSFLRGQGVQHAKKTWTLHKNCGECGARLLLFGVGDGGLANLLVEFRLL